MRLMMLCVTTVILTASSAAGNPPSPSFDLLSGRPVRDPWRLDRLFATESSTPAIPPISLKLPSTALQQDTPQPVHAVAVEHSDGYQTRAKIHKYASFATLPLFAAEVALGQSLDGSRDSKKGIHGAVGAGIVGLFAVNTVTGAWNLFGEGRQDKEGRTLRLVHGLLTMAADAGFVATTLSAPSDHPRIKTTRSSGCPKIIAFSAQNTIRNISRMVPTRPGGRPGTWTAT
jgi:hypothetical protein